MSYYPKKFISSTVLCRYKVQVRINFANSKVPFTDVENAHGKLLSIRPPTDSAAWRIPILRARSDAWEVSRSSLDPWNCSGVRRLLLLMHWKGIRYDLRNSTCQLEGGCCRSRLVAVPNFLHFAWLFVTVGGTSHVAQTSRRAWQTMMQCVELPPYRVLHPARSTDSLLFSRLSFLV